MDFIPIPRNGNYTHILKLFTQKPPVYISPGLVLLPWPCGQKTEELLMTGASQWVGQATVKVGARPRGEDFHLLLFTEDSTDKLR